MLTRHWAVVEQRCLDQIQKIVREYRDRDYDLAADRAEKLLDAAAKSSRQELTLIARMLGADPSLQPIFSHRGEANMATGFFQRLIAALEKYLPADDPTLARAFDRLALMYALHEQFDASARLLERSLRSNEKHHGPHSEHARLVRSNLAIQYRNMQQTNQSDKLFANTRICDHLQPVLEYIVKQGVHIGDVGTPWSNECNVWVYFEEAVLDAESLKKRFCLPDVVAVHTHRGTHDGSEHGLVCNEHHDALMGAHPSNAESMRTIR